MTRLRLLLLLSCISSMTILPAQLPDSCSASPLVREHYLNSAKIIALRQMLGDSVWTDSVQVPATLYNPVLNALSAVYNATSYPERDTVTKCLDIQAFPPWAIGGGNNIVLDTVAAGVTLTYHVGWGDCPAGCIFDRSWTFLIKPDCSVEFVGVAGDPLTSEVTCSSTSDCTTKPLCLPWLQDTIQNYAAQYPDCQQLSSGIHVTLHQDFNSVPVIGIHVFIGIDASFTEFFYCNGDYIGSCQITIAGSDCMPDNVSDYFDFATDTIWDCSRPLPTAENCGVTATRTPNVATISFQLSPNPATAGQTLVQANFGVRTRGRLSVFDVLGKSILEKTFEADQLAETLDFGSQKPGIYFVRLDTGKQVYTRKLLIIKP